MARFLFNHVDYSLHVGSQDPPTGNAAIGVDSGPAISGAEQQYLLACFNGGFKMSSGAGGFEVGGQVLAPLSNGLASLVIDSAGVGRVGVWGQDLPPPGVQVVSVRQNLPPLVAGGQPSPQIGAVFSWGATLGGGASVARSALGQDSQGDLLYAASMYAVPADLATALIAAGATVAMELDINPTWVQLATAAAPGRAAGRPGAGTEPPSEPVPSRLDAGLHRRPVHRLNGRAGVEMLDPANTVILHNLRHSNTDGHGRGVMGRRVAEGCGGHRAVLSLVGSKGLRRD